MLVDGIVVDYEGDRCGPLGAPSGLYVVETGVDNVRLDWEDSTENYLDHYKVYRSTTSGFSIDSENLVDEDVFESEYTNSGLFDNRTYYYRVTAVDICGNESLASDEVAATTLPDNEEHSEDWVDVDWDSDIDIVDALKVARHDAGLIGRSEINISAADVTDCGKGSVDIVDALQIARYDAGLIETFGCT